MPATKRRRRDVPFLLLPTMTAMLALVLIAGPALAQETVLEGESFWRLQATWAPLVTGTAEDHAVRGDFPRTEAPPADWTAADFDDMNWWRGRGPFFAGRKGYGISQPLNLATLHLRGKFHVTHPARAGELTLDLGYRGGVVVYLNGQEIHRQYMPAGSVDTTTLAEDYPEEVYVDGNGRVIGPLGENGQHNLDRLDKRRRTATDITLPADALRQGVNVLAIQIHRTARRTDLGSYPGGRDAWGTAAFLDAQLTTTQPNVVQGPDQRMEDVQVWNANPLVAIPTSAATGDPFDELGPIRLVAARNGAASGQVVVSADKSLGRVTARVAPLRAVEGGGGIPAEAVTIRYAGESFVPYMDALLDASNSDAPVQPVWVTVDVPADAQPGRYEGTLVIQQARRPLAEVPIELTVGRYRLPDPRDYRSHANLPHSPETLARSYDVERWSPRHFQFMQRTLTMLGQLGNDVVFLPLMRHTHFSNEQSMVRWRSRGGGHEPDLSVVRQYLEMIDRVHGEPSVVCLYLWEPAWGGRRYEGQTPEMTVSTLERGGRIGEIAAPYYGEPGSEAFWRPAIEGINAIADDLGWDRDALMLGTPGDARPNENVIAFFDEVAPEMKWMLWTHGRGDPLPEDGNLVVGEGLRVGYMEWPFNRESESALRRDLMLGWDAPFLLVTTLRGWIDDDSQPGAYRNMPYVSVAGRHRGYARINADFWPVGDGSILGRHHRWHNLMRGNPRSLLAPGPEGPVATVRYEMLREGTQETEARIMLEQAMHDSAIRDRLPAPLRERVQDLLQRRAAAAEVGLKSYEWYAGSGWQERTLELYDLAGEVAEQLNLP
ncbi:MAG: glycoside hydrolase domain-containing protein [Phycisphaeraceae bacterium]